MSATPLHLLRRWVSESPWTAKIAQIALADIVGAKLVPDETDNDRIGALFAIRDAYLKASIRTNDARKCFHEAEEEERLWKQAYARAHRELKESLATSTEPPPG